MVGTHSRRICKMIYHFVVRHKLQAMYVVLSLEGNVIYRLSSNLKAATSLPPFGSLIFESCQYVFSAVWNDMRQRTVTLGQFLANHQMLALGASAGAHTNFLYVVAYPTETKSTLSYTAS
jgi:hypothetical protein